MPSNKLSLFLLLFSALALSGCDTATKQEQGRVIGSIAGGVLGNQVGRGRGRTAAVIAGTILGGYWGGKIGQTMDENDRYRTQQALEKNPSKQPSQWHNPDTGNDYQVTPTRTYYEEQQPCREYTTEAWIGGKKETIYGTACRQADGAWKVVNN